MEPSSYAFGVPIWIIPASSNYHEKEYPKLIKEAYRIEKNKPNQNEYDGWSTNGYNSGILSPNEMIRIFKYVKSKIDTLNFGFDFSLTDGWLNINRRGHHILPHDHSMLGLSVVFLLTADDSKFTLINPNHMPYTIGKYCFFDYTPNCNAGDVLVFPSNYTHYVKPNDTDEDRITSAFNIVT